MEVKEHSKNLKIKGYLGSWKVIKTEIFNNKKIFILENEKYLSKVPKIVVDELGIIVIDYEFRECL